MMSEPTQSGFDDKLARFARGDLTEAEARELAQAALESPLWFEELTATAMARTAVSAVPLPAEPIPRRWWRSPFLLAAAAVVVIGIVVVPYVVRISPKQTDSASVDTPQSPATATPTPTPTLVLQVGSEQPVLLAEGLQPAAPMSKAQVFRGEEQPTRPPRQTGAIVEIDAGVATINLGSIDGLAKGSTVEIYSDTLEHRIGTLTLGTVFREQARGEIRETGVTVQCAVRVSDGDHLQALLQAASDLHVRRESTQARLAAAGAYEWAKRAKVTNSQKANAAALLASLDFQANDLAPSETHYRAALDLLTAGPNSPADEIAKLQNDMAVLAMLRGDYSNAQKLLGGAGVLSDPKLKAERLNNLGVLAEEHGALRQAEAFYDEASKILPESSTKERKIVEVNLNRVKGLH